MGIGQSWSEDNARFENSNPNLRQRMLRSLNPMTAYGSSLGMAYDAAQERDAAKYALAVISGIPIAGHAKAVRPFLAKEDIMKNLYMKTAIGGAKNTAFGVGVDMQDAPHDTVNGYVVKRMDEIYK